jgi:hypothetical protein
MRRLWCGLIVIAGVASAGWRLRAERDTPAARPWTFVASGDARNCGDIVMPAIAQIVRTNDASFYWHLGDLRKTSGQDEDIQNQHRAAPLSEDDYHAVEWQDFIDNGIAPFGSIAFFVGIGNHEVYPPKTREEFIAKFGPWLDAPRLKAQRLKDYGVDVRTTSYYHWIDRGVAFYFLDNASIDQFDDAQLSWFERALARDAADPLVTTIVTGMHKALPDGYNMEHSMNESLRSAETGRRVYADLLTARDEGRKRVYVLASHQHFYMEDAYGTPYWKNHGGVLPGWVVGTAGAVRYTLPIPSPTVAMTNVYGSLLGTVRADGEIRFEFKPVNEADIPSAVTRRYGQEFVHWCFANNTNVGPIGAIYVPPPR